jgi:SH3 domain protein
MKRMIALLGILGLAPVLSGAETAYVTDMLRLGIHNAEDTSDRPFDNLVSGTPLEVLERATNYARVRTPGGQEGWVKSAYIVTEKPAQARIAEAEAEIERLRTALGAAQDAHDEAETTADALSRQVAASEGSDEAIRETLERLKRENMSYTEQLDVYRGALPLAWVVPAILVTLVAGFVAGWWWLDSSIRRRHGGFRIH